MVFTAELRRLQRRYLRLSEMLEVHEVWQNMSTEIRGRSTRDVRKVRSMPAWRRPPWLPTPLPWAGVLARVADVASSDLLAFIDVDERGGVKVAEGAAHFLAPRKRRWPLSPDDKQDRSDVDCLVRASHNELWSMRRHGSPPGVEPGFRGGEVPIRISCESRVRRNVRGRSRSSLRLDRPACTALMTLISPLEAESWRRQSRSPMASNHSP